MNEVTKEQFFAAINLLNVHPSPEGRWPYTSVFKTPYGEAKGKIVDYLPEGSGLTKSRYYLPA